MIRVTPPTAATTATTPTAAPTLPSVASRTALLHRAQIFGSCPGYRAGPEVLVRRPPHFGCLDRISDALELVPLQADDRPACRLEGFAGSQDRVRSGRLAQPRGAVDGSAPDRGARAVHLAPVNADANLRR